MGQQALCNMCTISGFLACEYLLNTKKEHNIIKFLIQRLI